MSHKAKVITTATHKKHKGWPVSPAVSYTPETLCPISGSPGCAWRTVPHPQVLMEFYSKEWPSRLPPLQTQEGEKEAENIFPAYIPPHLVAPHRNQKPTWVCVPLGYANSIKKKLFEPGTVA